MITYPDSRRFMALWSSGSWSVTSLQVGFVEAINEAGQVVGNTSATTSAPSHAFLWDNGLLRDLGTLWPGGSVAYDVNNLSQVVGYSFGEVGGAVAFLWDQGVMYGVPVAGVQKTTIHTFTVKGEEENEGLRPRYAWT